MELKQFQQKMMGMINRSRQVRHQIFGTSIHESAENRTNIKNNQQYNEISEQKTPTSLHSSFQELSSSQSQIDFQDRKKIQETKKMMQMNQTITMIMCAGCMCFFSCLVILLIGYYLFWDSIKLYYDEIFPKQQFKFLTQQNAIQYFSHHQIIAGEMHFARIPHQYWEHRIQMAKSLGMNTIGTYVFWNYHQVQKGKFDFSTGNKDLPAFLSLARKHNMSVLLRPGPYVCSEWDWGGIPARLFAIDDLKIRTANNLFIEETKIYFEQLYKVIKPYIKSPKIPDGPILMVQVQNQPGLFKTQKQYIFRLKSLWEQLKIECPLYFDDSIQSYLDSKQKLHWQNAILGLNYPLYSQQSEKKLQTIKNARFEGQVYSGWFSKWGEQKNSSKQLDKYLTHFYDQFSLLLQKKESFSMYLVHGGTNFGLTAGFGMTTSYDYAAPINEQGSMTEKYNVFRSLMTSYSKETLVAPPASIETMNVTLGKTVALSSIFDNFPEGDQFKYSPNQPLAFESKELQMFDQGIVIYETALEGSSSYQFQLVVHDVALIYLDGELEDTIIRIFNQSENTVNNITLSCKKPLCLLQIIVEAMGHASFGYEQMLNDKKGLLKFVDKNQKEKTFLWKYYKFDLQSQLPWKNVETCEKSPCLFYAQADLKQNHDTYINLSNLQKGYVWVNGHSLGRYWNVGPQQKLYCPGAWLMKGKNKIVILDLFEKLAEIQLKGESSLF